MVYVGGQRTTTVAVCHCTQTAAPAGRVALPALLLSSWPTVAIAIFLLFLRSQSRPRKWPLLRVLPHAQVYRVCVFAHKAQNHRQCLCVCVRQAVFASMELGQSPVFIGNFETFSKYIFVQF